MNNKIIIWKCDNCGNINYSNPFRHHSMEYCNCDQSGMDLETYGNRILGDVTILEEINPFFDEIIICMIEQGFTENIFRCEENISITLNEIYFIRDLEDNIIKDYIKEVYK